MEEEVDGLQKDILRGYTMLAIYILKEYVDECRRRNIEPKEIGTILKVCGLENLANRILLRSMRR